jgi:hypothetical protein
VSQVESHPGEWRDRLLREAQEELDRDTAHIEAAYRLALWAARHRYRERAALVDELGYGVQGLLDPLTGRPMGSHGAPGGVPGGEERRGGVVADPAVSGPVVSEDQGSGSEVVEPGSPDPRDDQRRYMLWNLVSKFNGPFLATRLVADYQRVSEDPGCNALQIRKYLGEWRRDGQLVSEVVKPTEGPPIVYWQASSYPRSITEGIQQLLQQGQRSASTASTTTRPRKAGQHGPDSAGHTDRD